MKTQRLFLIDAHALCYRAFYAVKGLTNSKGQPTNAVYGFVNALRKWQRDFEPQYCAVCFDKDGKTFRQEKYADYKIQRPPMPDELRSQIPRIQDMLKAYGLPIIEKEGFEADDLIGALARRMASPQCEVVIITDDKDLFQLVGDHVKVYSPRREKMLESDDVKTIMGVAPEHITDFIALAGDSSDNIPGVAGVGKVSAVKLITQFGSLENILKQAEEITSKSLRTKIETGRDSAILSKDLAQLRFDAPVDENIEQLKVNDQDQEALYALFNDLEFHRFAAEYMPQQGGEKVEIAQITPDTETDVAKALKDVMAQSVCGIWLTDDEDGGQTCVVSNGDKAVAVGRDFLITLADMLNTEDLKIIVYDLKKMLKALGMDTVSGQRQVFDVFLAGYILHPVRGGQEIGSLAWQYLGQHVPAEDAAQCSAALVKLYDPLYAALDERGVLALFQDVEIPLAFILKRMEDIGIRIDVDLLNDLSAQCAEKIGSLENDIYEMAGEEFNVNSPKQLGVILFEKLKLPPVKKTKTGFSTNEEVLTRLAAKHPLPAAVLEYRQLAKLKSTYIDALPQLAQGTDHVIHTSFNQAVTETGRLSSSNPNLQNIPVRTELGRQIRQAFIPSQKGRVLVAADYSQIELRVLAHMSKDEALSQAFDQDEDIHNFTASLMFDVDQKDVTSDMRVAAKRVNFGIIYGMSAFGLAKDLNVSVAQAQDFIDRYFFRYPRVKDFMDTLVEMCRKQGYVETIMHRRRDIPEIVSRNAAVRQFAERQAINAPVQGSAADIMKLAMVNIDNALKNNDFESQMILTVHDEVVFDTVVKEERRLIEMICREMERVVELSVPLKVSVKRGENWLEMEEV